MKNNSTTPIKKSKGEKRKPEDSQYAIIENPSTENQDSENCPDAPTKKRPAVDQDNDQHHLENHFENQMLIGELDLTLALFLEVGVK